MVERGVLAGERLARAGENGHDPAGARRVSRRRPLPAGRALVGGLLVAVAAVGLYSAYTQTESGPSQSYTVASRALPAGTRLAPADLVLAPAELPDAVAVRAFADPDVLVEATLIAPLAAGELVQASAVVVKESDPASREVTFAISRDALPPSLEHGEQVDVLATYGSGGDALTVPVVRSVPLVALESPTGRLGDESTAVLTLALAGPDDSLALAHAVSVGQLTVVRATGAPQLAPDAAYRQPSPSPGTP